MKISKDLIISETNMTLGETAYKDVYSTSGVKTNKIWIDGKPIYKKVLDITSGMSASFSVPHNIKNID